MSRRIAIPALNINYKINSSKDLDIISSQIVNTFSQYIAELARDFMQDFINEKVYMDNVLTGGTVPKAYERTGELLNAVTCTLTSKGKWTIGIDGRKLHANARGSYTDSWGEHVGWGQHSSIDGVSQAGNMSEFINDGNGDSLYSYEGIHFIEATQAYIDSIYQFEWEKFAIKNRLK